RVRGRFMNFSLWTSALAFFFIEGYALQDQLAIGHASIIFMLGTACLVGSCGHCGRRLRTHYRGRSSAPGYHCAGDRLVEGRGSYCLNVGGIQIDEAVTRAFIAALEPAKLAATLAAAERLESDREATKGRKKGIRIKVIAQQSELFDQTS
ncbi:MAG TPA: hypothetical protein VGI22_15715, partial [Xanthobacteraceae bacterium]